MRENLFKGIREDNGNWVYGMPCATEQGIYGIQTLQGGIFDVFPETVCQYTGVNDINANKIFEHDIVRKYVDGKELIGVVEFSDGAFGVRFADSSGQLLCFFGDCCEVIGNIHNDPEITLG